ncbi:MAG: cation:proton antiporter [Ignavibacteria bacterium]|nr:cation:proton antiporter [Ignavibacteria bacterium]
MNFNSGLRPFLTVLFLSVIILFQSYDDLKCENALTSTNQLSDTTKDSAQTDEASHGDRFAPIYIVLFSIISGAVIGRFLARKFKQPAVLGELVVGVIIGTILYQMNVPIMTLLRHQDDVDKTIEYNIAKDETWSESVTRGIPEEAFGGGGYGDELKEIMLDPSFPGNNLTVDAILLLSSLGVLLLLFVVGLETSLEEMIHVGKPAMVTAVIGVVVPSLLGYFVSMLMLPDHDQNFYLFVGAALCATSIGITARVFKDLRKLHIPEAKIVLGAAVVDDVLGLIILAVVAGIISSGSLDFLTIGIILLKSILFLGITLYIGTKYLRQQIKIAAIIDNKNIRLLFPFALLVFLAWLSDLIGLASIVGAFAAGLIIKEEYFNDALKDKNISVKDVIEPIEAIFAPVFFVIMGMQVDVSSFGNFNILGVALALTAVAIFGKLISGIFAKGMDKKIIGIGMVPRGEVGLIFAGIGKELGVLDGALFSAIIIIVILTTFITPPALKWAFESYDHKKR